MQTPRRVAPWRSPRPLRRFFRARNPAPPSMPERHREQHHDDQVVATLRCLRHPRRLPPGPRRHECHGTSPERGGFHPQRPAAVRPGAGPGGPSVRRREPGPERLGTLQLRDVQTRQREDRRPVDRRGGQRCIQLLRRDRFEVVEPPLMVQLDVAHARHDRRRIVAVHEAGRQQVVVEHDGGQRFAALPVPELQRRRTLRVDLVPVGRWFVVLRHILDEIVVPLEAGRFVARARRRDQLTNGITRLLREHLGRVFRPHAIERAGPQRHPERCRDAGEHRQEHRPRDARTEAGALSRGRDHLRRRRLASRERRGQRIAARQRRGHRERRGRPPIGIGLQTAQNGALDRRVDRTHHARRRRRSIAFSC